MHVILNSHGVILANNMQALATLLKTIAYAISAYVYPHWSRNLSEYIYDVEASRSIIIL